MRIKSLLCTLAILTAIIAGVPMSLHPAGKEGLLLSLSCTSCHGTYGLSPGAIPTLYGKSRKYLIKTLIEFRNGDRDSTIMERIAKGYTENDIRLIANYFSSLTKKKKK
ncbi:MAG: Cytochrome subunit of sulfide dehydrogenase [Deltaproteobacteria bacterium]|jgi:sulfide dehydrogenase cytochrome subunit|nr:Cytochrome subunit of sulfide dehydrogenase [Deltaproteobacteria bacterium]